MRFEKIKDLAAGALMLGLGLILFVTSFSIPAGASLGLGPSFMPRLMSGVLVLFGVLICLGGVKAFRAEEGKPAVKQEGAEKGDKKAVALTLAFLLAYILLMKPAGFILATGGYIMAQILLFAHNRKPGKKEKVKYLVISAVSSVAIYIIFTKGFSLLLPAGILG